MNFTITQSCNGKDYLVHGLHQGLFYYLDKRLKLRSSNYEECYFPSLEEAKKAILCYNKPVNEEEVMEQ